MPQGIERLSKATKLITSRMRLDWARKASDNADGFLKAYAKNRFKMRATYELRDAVGLLLDLMHDPSTKGAMDLGSKYVNIRAEQFERAAARFEEKANRGNSSN